MSAADKFSGRYMTQAVESTVLDRGRGEIGHVGLLDVDGVGESVARSVAAFLPGPVAVLRSSEHAYHLWALTLHSHIDAWTNRVENVHVVDDDHVALSTHRGCGVLRVDEKVAVATGETVKPAPTLVEVVDADSGHDRRLSEPHARILRNEFGACLDVEDGREWVGHSAPRRTYMADIGGRSGGA